MVTLSWPQTQADAAATYQSILLRLRCVGLPLQLERSFGFWAHFLARREREREHVVQVGGPRRDSQIYYRVLRLLRLTNAPRAGGAGGTRHSTTRATTVGSRTSYW
jgi:hypothetical protein